MPLRESTESQGKRSVTPVLADCTEAQWGPFQMLQDCIHFTEINSQNSLEQNSLEEK